MMKKANPRVAEMQYVRLPQQVDRDHPNLIAARVSKGPQAELGKTVHVVVTRANLPALRLLVEALENGKR